MSYAAVDLVLESDLYKGPTKAVLVALAHHINSKRDDNEVWPSLPRLMQISGYSRSTVQRCLDELITDGIVVQSSPSTGARSARYLVYLGKLALGKVSGSDPGDSKGIGERPIEASESDPQGIVAGEKQPAEYRSDTRKKNFSEPCNVNRELEAEEQAAAAASRSAHKPYPPSAGQNQNQDPLLITIVKSYGRNDDSVDQILPLLEKHHITPADLTEAIAAAKAADDPFMANHIRTWDGLIRCLTSGGFIDQWRNPPRTKKKSHSTPDPFGGLKL